MIGRPRLVAGLLAAVLATAAAPALADDAATRPITLADAVATARAANDAYLAEVASSDRAAAEARAAAGIDDVVVELGADGLTRSIDPVDGPFFQETDLDALGARAAVWKPLAWGGRIGVEVGTEVARSTSRIAAGGPVQDITATIHRPRAELVWMQPLLRDRGAAAHQAPRRIAAAGAEAAVALRTLAETGLVRDVTRAYWELAYAAREVTIRRSALALAEEQLTITRARAAVGKLPELEVLAVEQAIAAREAALTGAEQAAAARALELRVLLALEDGDPRPLAAADALEVDAAPPRNDALARALAFSPELRALDHHARAAGVALDAAEADLRPRLDLVVRGGPIGNAGSAGDAWAQLGRLDGYQATAALSFSLPVGNRTARGRRDAARLDRKRLAHDRAAVRGRLIAEVTRAVDAVTLTERRIVAAAKAAELARRNVVLEQARWQHGAGTNFDVLTRQDQAAAADAALARARAEHRIAIAELAALTGEAAGPPRTPDRG